MDLDFPSVLFCGLAVVVAVALVWAGSTSGAAFGTYNHAWDGSSDLSAVARSAGAEPTVVRNTTAYDRATPRRTVAIVLSPETAYAPVESARLRRFVEAGGTLVVAEDFGPNANPLLSAVGARARVDGRLLVDEEHYYRAPEFPVAANVTPSRYTTGVDALTLNHGTAVVPNGATTLVASSDVAFLDENGNGALDDDESIGPFPVATVESVGRGHVVVVGDASALINVMLDRPGNRAFLAAVVAGHDRVLLDASHAGTLPPLAVAVLLVRRSPLLQALVGLLAVGAVGLWVAWGGAADATDGAGAAANVRGLSGRLRRRTHVSPRGSETDAGRVRTEALATRLRERHPGWHPERVERVVAAVVREEAADEARRRDGWDEPPRER